MMIDIPSEMYRELVTADGRIVHICTERQIALHVVGLDYKRPYTRHGMKFYRPYRNYFTGKNPFLERLVNAGFMEVERTDDPNKVMYRYNRAGLDWLAGQIGVHSYNEGR